MANKKLESVNTDAIVSSIVDKAAAAGTTITKKLAKEIMGYFFDSCEDALKGMKRVQLPGYLTIDLKYSAARDGKNPLSGEPMTVPAAVMVTAKAGQKLKDAAKGAIDPKALAKAIKN